LDVPQLQAQLCDLEWYTEYGEPDKISSFSIPIVSQLLAEHEIG
jgi:hypothetical protein